MTQSPLVQRSWRTRLIHRPDAPAEILERLSQQPDTLVDGGEPLKNKPRDRCTIVRFDSSVGPLVLKRFNLKSLPHTLTHAILRTRASWGWRNARRLLDAGLLTPRPLACLERRIGPLRMESYLLSEFIEGPTLKRFMEEHSNDPAALAAAAREFAQLWRGLGSLRAAHSDMKATNFIVGEDARIWMVDLDGMRIGVPPPLYRPMRRRNLERFMRNWREAPAAQAAFRARLDTA